MNYRVYCVVLGVALGGFSGVSEADVGLFDSISDQLGPREIAVGESMRANARGSMAITLNPSGLSLTSEVAFEATVGMRPGDDGKSMMISGCDSAARIQGCYYYRFFQSEPTIGDTTLKFKAHEAGMVYSRRITQNVVIGSTARYIDFESEEDSFDGFTMDLGATMILTPRINLGVVGYNLLATKSAVYERAIGVGVAANALDKLWLAFDGRWGLEDESASRYGCGAEFYFSGSDGQSAYPVRLGAIFDTGSDSTFITGGFGFHSHKLGLDIGVRKEVKGGDELMVLAGLRIFGPRFPAGRAP